MNQTVPMEMCPTHPIVKWLGKSFQNMEKQFETRFAKESSELFQALQFISEVEVDEILIHFDVKALFFKVPPIREFRSPKGGASLYLRCQ